MAVERIHGPRELNEHRLGSQATTVAEDIARVMTQQDEVIRRFDCGPIVGEVSSGRATEIVVPEHVSGRDQHAVRSSIVAAAVHRIWRRGRIVYAVHPHMVSELIGCTSGSIPGMIFEYLPHTNPLITFPDPLDTTTPDGRCGRILGFYVHGVTDHPRRLVSSHDDHRFGLGIMVVTAIVDHHGRRVDTDFTRLTVPLCDQFTVDSAVEATLDTFTTGPELRSLAAETRAWLVELAHIVIALLLYLCSSEPDTIAMPSPRPTRNRRSSKNMSTPTQRRMIKVGWQLGPQLFTERRQATVKTALSTDGDRRRQRPHQRKCHFRAQRVGKGRHEVVLRLIKPYWVSLDLLPTNTAPDHTVVAISPRHPPENARHV